MGKRGGHILVGMGRGENDEMIALSSSAAVCHLLGTSEGMDEATSFLHDNGQWFFCDPHDEFIIM